LLLAFGAEPDQRHQRQPIDKEHGGKAGIDGADFLDDDLEIDIHYPATAVSLRDEARGEAELVAFHIGPFDGLEGLLWVLILIRRTYERRENFVGKFASDPLQAFLIRCQREVDRHPWLRFRVGFQDSFAHSEPGCPRVLRANLLLVHS
jgi:hypothetical protein